jgi:hypothetical protein
MLIWVALLTAAYFAGVWWVRRGSHRARITRLVAPSAGLPAADQPPPTAVGWPPKGVQFTAYVLRGIAALDEYRSEGHAA